MNHFAIQNGAVWGAAKGVGREMSHNCFNSAVAPRLTTAVFTQAKEELIAEALIYLD